MSAEPPPPLLEVALTRQIHPGLRLDVAVAIADECAVVFGPSGAGKSSLLRLIAGLDHPDRGTVRLGGETLTDTERRIHVSLRYRRIGLIFQDDLLFPHLDAAGNIAFGLDRWGRREAAARVEEVGALCGVTPLLRRRVATLSGGERQRVGLARALAPRPRLLLADEPVSALDLDARFLLLEHLRAIPHAEGIPVLLVTHSPAEAVAAASRLFLLRGGRIVARGSPLDVLAARQGPEALEGLRNVFSASVVDHFEADTATRLRLDGGPDLTIPYNGLAPGTRLAVAIRADDILLARGPIAGVSARNVVPGTVDRIVGHGREAEIMVRTGQVAWIVSLVEPAVEALGLEPGAEVHLVLKARSCHVLGLETPP